MATLFILPLLLVACAFIIRRVRAARGGRRPAEPTAHQRIVAEIDAASEAALPELVGAAALSARRLNAEHGERTLELIMSDGRSITLASMAAPMRRELDRRLQSGPALLVDAGRDALAYRLEFVDFLGARYAVWSRRVCVIDGALVTSPTS